MSIFGSIMSKIFGASPASAQPAATAAPVAGAPAAAAVSGAALAAAAPAAPVDVAKVLDDMLATSGAHLNWRTSIVDLMKLLGLDSSLGNRQGLADELGYTGDKNDSAAMNVWLHKQVMQKLAANGGVVPPDL